MVNVFSIGILNFICELMCIDDNIMFIAPVNKTKNNHMIKIIIFEKSYLYLVKINKIKIMIDKIYSIW